MTKININISLVCAISTIILTVLTYFVGYYNSIRLSSVTEMKLNLPLVALAYVGVILIIITPIIGVITGFRSSNGVGKYIGITLNTLLFFTVSLFYIFMFFLYTP